MHLHDDSGPRGRVQTDGLERRLRKDPALRLPEHVLRLAQAEYDRQFPGQPYERMQERGGLSLLEVVGLLADHLDRVGAKSSVPAREGGEKQ